MTSIFLKGKKSDNLSSGKTAKCGSGLGFLPLLLCCFCLSKPRPSCSPHSLIQRGPSLAGKTSQGGRGGGRQTGTALGYDVLVCSLFCSQAPKPPKDKEEIRQRGHGCMTSDCEGWRLAVSHTKLLAQEDFVPNFSSPCPVSWMNTWRCLSSLDSDLFLRALKHSKTPVLPGRNPYVSKDFEYFLVFPS